MKSDGTHHFPKVPTLFNPFVVIHVRQADIELNGQNRVRLKRDTLMHTQGSA